MTSAKYNRQGEIFNDNMYALLHWVYAYHDNGSDFSVDEIVATYHIRTSKVTQEQIDEMHRMNKEEGMTYKQIAKVFGVSYTCVYRKFKKSRRKKSGRKKKA